MRLNSFIARVLQRAVAGRLTGILFLFVPVWCAAEIHWEAQWSTVLQGQRIAFETFSSPTPPDAAAQELARKNKAFERYIVADGRILLSGIEAGVHWLAEVKGHPDGSHGYVSALYFDHEQAGRQSSERHALSGTNALRVFDFGSAAIGILKKDQGFATEKSVDARLSRSRSEAMIFPDPHLPLAVAVSMPER